jgi:hypothetical protein
MTLWKKGGHPRIYRSPELRDLEAKLLALLQVWEFSSQE